MKRSITLHQDEVLDKEQRALLPLLCIFRERGYYLAGGTALALYYGHRMSEDFDFFMSEDFDSHELFLFCQSHFSHHTVINILESENTLWITVNGVKLSFFTLHAPLLAPLIETLHLDLASISDISAMRLGAIQHRATEKDYIDIARILEDMEFGELLVYFEQKYGTIIAPGQLIKSLIYFDDVIPAPIGVLDPRYSYEHSREILETKIKSFIKK